MVEHEIHIRPNRSYFRVDWREFWEYRDLFYLMVRRDFVAKYKQTILGPAWFVLQPLLMTLVFTVIFGRVARIPTDGLPQGLFYLCGLLAWNYFSNTLSVTSNTLTANAQLFGKVYFPRLVVPFSMAVSNLFAWAIQLATFFAFWIYFKAFAASGARIHLGPSVVLLPLLVLHSALLSVGVGLWFSAATAKYRDLTYLMGFIIQIWMYGTPVIYPLSRVPDRWRWLVDLNPMSAVLESYKCLLLGEGTVTFQTYALSLSMTLVLFFTGLMVFHKAERSFIDTV